MAGRKIPLANGEYYHVYNRGTARQPVFLSKRDYERFIFTLSYYHFLKIPLKLSRFLQLPMDRRNSFLRELDQEKEKLVEIISFVLLPNHFHLLVKQTADGGISTFLSKATNSYTRYLNTKRARVGPLFQGTFKAVHVETDEQLLHLSRYIHLNPLVSFIVKESDFLSYPWSSLSDFLKGRSSFIHLEPILTHFSSPKVYERFVLDQADYAKKLAEIKYLTLEE